MSGHLKRRIERLETLVDELLDEDEAAETESSADEEEFDEEDEDE
jgi:hypothetical protein